jgi:hypothetical protein
VDEDTFIRGDGSKIPVAYVLAPFESAEGDGSVIVFSDITRMKAERQRLQVESERFSHVRDLHEALNEQRFKRTRSRSSTSTPAPRSGFPAPSFPPPSGVGSSARSTAGSSARPRTSPATAIASS